MLLGPWINHVPVAPAVVTIERLSAKADRLLFRLKVGLRLEAA